MRLLKIQGTSAPVLRRMDTAHLNHLAARSTGFGMRLYFMRHADALDGEDDAARPLSPRGRDQSEAMAKFLSRARVEFQAAYASPLVRAHQTAEIILRAMGFAGAVKLQIAQALTNETTEPEWNRWTGSLAEHDDVLLVGHAPSLAEHVRALLAVAHSTTFEMPKGAIACVDTQDRHSGRLKFFVTPKLLGL